MSTFAPPHDLEAAPEATAGQHHLSVALLTTTYLILHISAPNQRGGTQTHNSSSSKIPDGGVDPEGTLLPAKMSPSLTQRNSKVPMMAIRPPSMVIRPPHIGSYTGPSQRPVTRSTLRV